MEILKKFHAVLVAHGVDDDPGLFAVTNWCTAFILLCFFVSVASANYSQVDKLWSITPWFYVWVLVFSPGGATNPRLLWMATVITVWGLRLTLNFHRRGGYKWPPWNGEEDYRWVHVREMMKADDYPLLWHIFNFCFICVYQHVLLMGTALPAYIAYKHNEPMDSIDWALGCLVLFLVTIEAVADEQQWIFQNEKYRGINAKSLSLLNCQYKNGFLQTGLFSLCRHPAYACEQSIWLVFYAFSYKLVGMNWTFFGAFLLLALFTPSSMFSEKLSMAKYPKYKVYQQTHCRFFPLGTLLSTIHEDLFRNQMGVF